MRSKDGGPSPKPRAEAAFSARTSTRCSANDGPTRYTTPGPRNRLGFADDHHLFQHAFALDQQRFVGCGEARGKTLAAHRCPPRMRNTASIQAASSSWIARSSGRMCNLRRRTNDAALLAAGLNRKERRRGFPGCPPVRRGDQMGLGSPSEGRFNRGRSRRRTSNSRRPPSTRIRPLPVGRRSPRARHETTAQPGPARRNRCAEPRRFPVHRSLG